MRRRRIEISEEQLKEVEKLRNMGKSWLQIGKQLKIDRRVVKKKFEKWWKGEEGWFCPMMGNRCHPNCVFKKEGDCLYLLDLKERFKAREYERAIEQLKKEHEQIVEQLKRRCEWLEARLDEQIEETRKLANELSDRRLQYKLLLASQNISEEQRRILEKELAQLEVEDILRRDIEGKG